MKNIKLQKDDKIARIIIDSDEENRITPEFVKELDTALDEVSNDTSKIVILESSKPDFFCNGFHPDVFLSAPTGTLLESMRNLILTGIKLFFLPKPTISLISGYAAGGGAFLATFTDFRFMNRNRSRLGFPEVQLGITIPPIILKLLVLKTGYQNTTLTVLQGKLFKADECKKYHLVDEVFENFEETRRHAFKLAENMSRHSLTSLMSLKMGITGELTTHHITSQIDRDIEEFHRVLQTSGYREKFQALKKKPARQQ